MGNDLNNKYYAYQPVRPPVVDPARQLLDEVRQSRLRRIRLEERVEQLRHALHAVNFSGAGVRVSGGKLNPVEDRLASLLEANDRLREELNEGLALERRAEALINTIEEPRVCIALYMRYLSGYTWQAVADSMNCSLRWVHRLHRIGLKELELMAAMRPELIRGGGMPEEQAL